MFWSWGTSVPVIAQVTVFTAAAGWFAGQAVFGVSGHGGAGCYGNWYYAGMMAVMGPMAGMSGMAMTGGAMAGMAMGGGTAAATSAVSMPAAGSPGWVGAVSVVLAVALFAAAAWQVYAVIRPLALAEPGTPLAGAPGGLGAAAGNGAGALAAAAMAVALLTMA